MSHTIPFPGSATGDPFRDRTPPYSEDAEQAVLSAMLMDADAIINCVEIVDDSMLYAEKHRRLFRAMVALLERGTVVDPITLGEELERRGELEASGGKDYIGYLVDAVPTAANVAFHAQIIREKATYRRVIEASVSLIQEAYAAKLPAAELLDAAEAKILGVTQARVATFTRVKELLWPAMQRIEQIHHEGKTVTGVASGFADLDDMTSGFQPSDLVIIAARPSMGKTALALNIAQHAAIEDGIPTAFFSLEMSKESLVQRLLTAEARIDAQRMRRGQLRDDEFPRLARAAGILSSAPIWIDDSAGMTVLEMRAKARRLKAEQNIGLLIVDYLQLMEGATAAENRQQEVSQISRGLKMLAKELRIPVIALSQLSRAPEMRTDHRPQLSDLRESGAIEQDADVICFVYRREVYEGLVDQDSGASLDGKAEIIVGKQRNGPVGSVNLAFYKNYTRFASWTSREGGAVA